MGFYTGMTAEEFTRAAEEQRQRDLREAIGLRNFYQRRVDELERRAPAAPAELREEKDDG